MRPSSPSAATGIKLIDQRVETANRGENVYPIVVAIVCNTNETAVIGTTAFVYKEQDITPSLLFI